MTWSLSDPIIKKEVRVTDAKEVAVGNRAEETCCHPNSNSKNLLTKDTSVGALSNGFCSEIHYKELGGFPYVRMSTACYFKREETVSLDVLPDG